MSKVSKIVLLLFCIFFIFSLNEIFAFTVIDYDNEVLEIPDIPPSIDLSNGYFYWRKRTNPPELYVLDDNSRACAGFKDNGEFVKIYAEWGSFSVYQYVDNNWTYSGSLSGRDWMLISDSDPSKRELYFALDIYLKGTDTIYLNAFKPTDVYPYIMDSEENLSLLNMDCITVDSGNVDIKPDYFDFIVCAYPLGGSERNTIYSTKLNPDSSFYQSGGLYGDYYEIPVSVFKNYLLKGNVVEYTLLYWVEGAEMSETSIISVVYGGDVTSQTDSILNSGFNKLDNKLNDISETLKASAKKQEETDKGILASIKEVISYLNPFSENFFVYKLIDLLIDALISLFVPSSEFFASWIADLNLYFADRFGMLYYPFELSINILNRVNNISSQINGNFVISFPDLQLMGVTLIPAFSYDFNILLQNETFAYIYDIYLIFIDVILICCLLVLCKNTFVEVFGGKFADDIASIVNSSSKNNN